MAKAKSKPQILFIDKSLDDLKSNALVLPFLSDEKPFKGLLGFADWRFNGNLSRQCMSNRVKGDLGELLLYPTCKKLGIENLLLLGLGLKKEVNEKTYQKALKSLMSCLSKSKIGNFSFGLNELIIARDQALWISGFLIKMTSEGRQAVAKPWSILTDHKNLSSCVESVKSHYGKQIDCKTESVPVQETVRKPFTLREPYAKVLN